MMAKQRQVRFYVLLYNHLHFLLFLIPSPVGFKPEAAAGSE